MSFHHRFLPDLFFLVQHTYPSIYTRVTHAPALEVGVFYGFKNCYPDPYPPYPYPCTRGVYQTRDQH
jgi:hypothetical protein